MSNRKIAFIVNPISGTKNKSEIIEKFKKIPSITNDIVEVYITKCAGDACEQSKKYAEQNFDIVVAVGGDGTVNEVAHGLVDTHTALGIIPLGSGNGLARELKISLKPKVAVDLLKDGIISEIDVCTLNGRPFFCTAGVGYDANVSKVFADAKTRGFFTYMISGLKAYIRMKPTNYKLTIDDKTYTPRAFDITFANAGQFGNDAYIAPLADLRDGLIDVVVIRPFPWYKCVAVGMRLFFKNMHKSRYVSVYKCNRAVLERPAKDYLHYDGEVSLGETKLEFGIKPKALKVLIGK